MNELPEMVEAKEKVLKVVDIMILADSDIKRIIQKYLSLLTDVSLEYKHLKKDFTFDVNRHLQRSVDSIIDSMQIELFNLINQRSIDAGLIGDDSTKHDTHPFLLIDFKGSTVNDRINNYLSQIKKETETYIAIGFSLGLSKNDIATLYLSNFKQPYKSQEFITAMNKGDYKAERIKNKGVTFGVGKYIAVYSGLKMLEQDTIYKAYNYSLQSNWLKSGNIVGWYTVRGSNFPCPSICDQMVKVFHPITESYYGYHTRCVCPMIPIKK